MRCDLKDDVVLIQLCIDERDLGLTEGRIQSGIKRLSGLAEFSCRYSVVRQHLIKASVLLIGIDILQAWQTLHLRK